MAAQNYNIMCWNVRGLNDGAKRSLVRTQIISSGVTVVCLQETKISNWTHSLLVDTAGTEMASNAIFLPSVGVCGCILIAASEHFFTLTQPHLTTNTVTTKLTILAENKEWSISGVYGPQNDADKILFLQEILDLR